MHRNSTVVDLETGTLFETKRMEGRAGTALPRHRASVESVLIVVSGECSLNLDGAERVMTQGESAVIPADVWHQITARPEFAAIHVMPIGIRFEFAS